MTPKVSPAIWQQSRSRGAWWPAASSGCLVDAQVRPPLLARVQISMPSRRGPPLQEQIVRHTERGFAIEWSTFPDSGVLALLARAPPFQVRMSKLFKFLVYVPDAAENGAARGRLKSSFRHPCRLDLPTFSQLSDDVTCVSDALLPVTAGNASYLTPRKESVGSPGQ